MKNNIAIVGNYPFTMWEAPFSDPSWDIWALGTNANLLPRWDVVFEIHDIDHVSELYGHIETWRAGWEYLQQEHPGKTIYTQGKHPKVPQSVPYPLDDILRKFGRHLWWVGRVENGKDCPPKRKRPYPFVASACFQLALAIDKLTPSVRRGKRPKIGMWGMDMTAVDEYVDQKPAVWSLIGFAMGRGIDVIVPEVSSLMKCRALYGFEPEDGGVITAKLSQMQTEYGRQIDGADELAKHRIAGALNMIDFIGREFA